VFSALLGSSECLAYLNPDGTASLFGLPLRRLSYTPISLFCHFAQEIPHNFLNIISDIILDFTKPLKEFPKNIQT
jgi:hypothetical protein